MGTKKKKSAAKGILSNWSWIVLVLIMVGGYLYGNFGNGIFGGKSHACIQDNMTAEVATDGSLHVTDARTYEFKGTYSLTAAVLDPPDNGKAIVNGVSVIDESGTETPLKEIEFQTSWRTSGGPPSGYYAIDTARDAIYAFSTTTDAKKTFKFDYTYTNAIDQYTDADILYWQFIGRKWDVDTSNVKLKLTLPVPAGQTVEGGKNVYAFGHGNLGGDVAFNSDGTITFSVPKVKSETFAEMRVSFPTDWTPNIDPVKVKGTSGLQDMLDEEKKWQDEAAVERLKSALLLVIPIGISVVCIIVGLILFLRHGKEYKPIAPLDYWRDVPEKGIHPAVIGRLWRWNEEDANDITTTLMHLSNLGVVRIDKVDQHVDRKVLPDKLDTAYMLTLDPERRDALQLSPIDTKVLSLVFSKIGNGNLTVNLEDIKKYGDKHPESYVAAVKSWQECIDKEVEQRNFFEKKGDSLKTWFRIIALLMLGISLFGSFTIENFAPLLGLLPGIIFLFVMGHFMPRRSHEAVEIQERCEGLERWFRDFTALNEAIPTDAKVWGELLVYAYVFGVAEQAVDNLNKVAPEIWNDGYWGPRMYWFYNPYGHIHSSASSGDFFGRAFDNTLSSANSAIAAANSSSGGGFGGGGGFSGGGGGGFGGGGGGFSR